MKRALPTSSWWKAPCTRKSTRWSSKLWARVESWGIAVAGGYWKPVLNVQVTPGAEQRFEELRVLLDGSGLEVRRSDK